MNRSTDHSPFSIVYTKSPYITIDLANHPNAKNKAAHVWAKDYVQFHHEIKSHIERMNAQYKEYADKRRRYKEFEEGDLVLVHLNKHGLPIGCSKLQNKEYGPFTIQKKINNNSYVIDLPSEWRISSTFNIADIHTYHPPDAASASVLNSRSNSLEERGADAVLGTKIHTGTITFAPFG